MPRLHSIQDETQLFEDTTSLYIAGIVTSYCKIQKHYCLFTVLSALIVTKRCSLCLCLLPLLTHDPDLRLPSTVPLNFTKSISLSLSERGTNAIKASGKPDLLETIISETLPMRGRMIHGKSASGEFYEQSQDYDIHGRVSNPTLSSMYSS